MKKIFTTILILICFNIAHSQKLLTAWSQQDIENYTKEMYDKAQKLSSTELLEKNLQDIYWSEVFLTLNASINHHSENKDYLKALANQITDETETKLKGTSRLIIWDRIISGDLIFEGKGLIVDNDLFTVAGRANQMLQNLTNKNFGFVTMETTEEELAEMSNKWLEFLSDMQVEEFEPIEHKNAKIPEVSSLNAVQALIISLQENPMKEQIIKNCLKNRFNLNKMPKKKSSLAKSCDPDTYTYTYLGILFGHEKPDRSKNEKWWLRFWNENGSNLTWNSDKGIYEIRK